MTITVITGQPISAGNDTRLTISEIITNVCREVGIEMPSSLVGNTDQTARELLHLSVEASEEIARRVDWGGLQSIHTITGTGTETEYTLPNGFSRLVSGSGVICNGSPVRGGLTEDEWSDLAAIEGTPRYFRIKGNAIEFYPYPALDQELSVSYQTEHWSSADLNYWQADDDRTLLPHQLLHKGIVWRWRRQKGEDFSDYLAEFEASLQDYAGFDSRARTP